MDSIQFKNLFAQSALLNVFWEHKLKRRLNNNNNMSTTPQQAHEDNLFTWNLFLYCAALPGIQLHRDTLSLPQWDGGEDQNSKSESTSGLR